LGLFLALAGASAGAPLGDLATLELKNDVRGGCGGDRLEFFRTSPDGSISPTPFRAQDGKALVVTDVDWHYFSGPPGATVILQMVVENLMDAGKRQRAAESVIRLERDGVGGTSEHLTTGFAVGSQSRLCVELVNAPIGSPMRLSKVLVRG
jgi:hypothetical protein